MQSDKIALIGDSQTACAFKASGVDVFSPATDEQTAELIEQLVKQNYAVILVTENMAENVMDLIFSFKSQPYPIILPIPTSSGSLGLGFKGMKYNIEKAVGMDIVFSKEEDE